MNDNAMNQGANPPAGGFPNQDTNPVPPPNPEPQKETKNPYDRIQHAAISPTRFDDRMSVAIGQDAKNGFGQNAIPAGQVMPAPMPVAPPANPGGKVSIGVAIGLGLVAVAGLAFGIWGIISSVMANSNFENLEAKINSLQSNVTSLNQTVTLYFEDNSNSTTGTGTNSATGDEAE